MKQTKISALILFLFLIGGGRAIAAEPAVEVVSHGVWQFTFGTPDRATPMSTRNFNPDAPGLGAMHDGECPLMPTAEVTDRGVVVRIPLESDELIYGLGLQMKDFQMRGTKKLLRVNADPELNTGDSHAPVPFYVTTNGYGIFIDNSRYMTFYLGNKKTKPASIDEAVMPPAGEEDGWNSLSWPYERLGMGEESEVIVEIPYAEGVRVLVFGGPTMKEAIARYNLYSGGGTLPPRWGLGFWYRGRSDYTQDEVIALSRYFRESNIPCDVLGLEPNWQTHAYSCSLVWGDRFPGPADMISELSANNFRVNLWQHAFINPSSPIYEDLLPYSGDYEVWGGIVPDFLTTEARGIFSDHILKECVEIGVSGFKADECDNSDFGGYYSFPELSRFPSGVDGEQMHTLFGLRYQDAILDAYNEEQSRTYGLVRSSGAFAAPYPFVLYSDLYDHRTFINSVAQAGFSGLLWTPEVRHAADRDDLIRRLQSVVLSPLAMVNGWYLKSPPWKQIRSDLNNQDIFDENWEQTEAICRDIINLRMQLVPYLHAAFVRYKNEGIPPFRALVVDYPDDENVQALSGQYLIGDNLMAAPVVAGQNSLSVYFPQGRWYDFFTGEVYDGGEYVSIDVPLDRIPLFVKEGTLLPLARVTSSTADVDGLKLTVRVYGESPEPFVLYEDRGEFQPSLQAETLTWNPSRKKGMLESGSGNTFYSVEKWEPVM
jgi:alpha-D-xyloside xylohydrolase